MSFGRCSKPAVVLEKSGLSTPSSGGPVNPKREIIINQASFIILKKKITYLGGFDLNHSFRLSRVNLAIRSPSVPLWGRLGLAQWALQRGVPPPSGAGPRPWGRRGKRACRSHGAQTRTLLIRRYSKAIAVDYVTVFHALQIKTIHVILMLP